MRLRYPVPRTSKVLATNSQQSRAVDLQYDPTAAWQYAIDPTTARFVNTPPSSGRLPSPIFDFGQSPVTITVTACPISWPIAGVQYAAPPPTSPACTGTARTIVLNPYGVSLYLLVPYTLSDRAARRPNCGSASSQSSERHDWMCLSRRSTSSRRNSTNPCVHIFRYSMHLLRSKKLLASSCHLSRMAERSGLAVG